MDMSFASADKTRTPVLIAGAGPTGLVLALWLRKKNIPFRIIDKSAQPGTTSRALAVQARTLEFYRQLGIAGELIGAGITVKDLVVRRLGKAVARARLGALGKDISPFPYLLFCSQDVHEELLCRILRQMNVTVERNTELVEYRQNEKGVTAILKTPHGRETVTADYLCGCDGAHSTVRHGLPAPFPGGTYSQVFYVADVLGEGEMAQGLQVSVSPKDFCIVMPIRARGTIRLVGTVPPENEDKENIGFEDVRESVSKNTGLNVRDVVWFSTYNVHHRIAESFRRGRVFLAGDAGHIHSPAGGQGMNTGIGDAVNLAWKLAEVISGHASPKLLDSYEPERMAFAKVLVRSTDTAFRFIASTSWFGSVFRAYILPGLFAALTRFEFFLRFAFRTISQTRIEYRASKISSGSAGGIVAGDRLPWVPYGTSDNFEPLKSMNWQAHIYGEVKNDFRANMQKLGLAIHSFPFSEEALDKGFRKDAVYILRPDGHVACALRNQDSESAESYFNKLGIRLILHPQTNK